MEGESERKCKCKCNRKGEDSMPVNNVQFTS